VLGDVESHMPAPTSVRVFCITMDLAAINHVLPVTQIDAANRATSTVLLQFALIFNLYHFELHIPCQIWRIKNINHKAHQVHIPISLLSSARDNSLSLFA